jgi:hypothetical protein
LVGITFQVPQKEPQYAWWCYLGERPEFENEFDADDKDKDYFGQCQAVPKLITKNMIAAEPKQAVVVDCPDCGGGDERCLTCDGTGTVIE